MSTTKRSDVDAVRAVATSDGTGCTLVDDIQGVRFHLQTPMSVRLEPCSGDGFCFPVDAAYRLSTSVVRVPKRVAVFVRDGDGRLVEEISNRNEAVVPDGAYTIEIGGIEIKTYLRVDGEVRVRTDEDRGLRIYATDGNRLVLGLRSFHEYPAATVTTTGEPRDVMRAISCLGSALKTTGCERSFPTLRGHPPRIVLGERFDAPPDFERTPETATVTIEVPEELSYVYPVAPLAYYLDGAVVPGETPRLLSGDVVHDLDGPGGFEATVGRILKHVFTLDCITRTEGYYPVQLGERELLEERIDIDIADLYQLAPTEQLNAYLSIPFEVLDGIRPRWPLTADIVPESELLSYVPYVVADLCTVRCPDLSAPTEIDVDPVKKEAIENFYRGGGSGQSEEDIFRGPENTLKTPQDILRDSDQSDTACSESSVSTPELPNVFKPESTDSITHMWIGDGYPILAAKPTLESCQRRLEATPSGATEVAVVSNSPEMREESDVAEMYGLRELVAFDVDVYEDLTKEELEAVWADDYDLVHYVGHVDDNGLQCADGWLDAESIEHVGVRAFVLNGCRSFEQGMALVDAGAIGGLCTLSYISNMPATSIGRTVARLLNAGFDLGGSLDIIKDELVTARRYMIVGDPRISIAEARVPISTFIKIEDIGRETVDMSIHGYPNRRGKIGTLYTPYIAENQSYYLNSGHIDDYSICAESVIDFLQLERVPVQIDRNVVWSDTLSVDKLTD